MNHRWKKRKESETTEHWSIKNWNGRSHWKLKSESLSNDYFTKFPRVGEFLDLNIFKSRLQFPSSKPIIESRTFLLWGDAVNHCIMFPLPGKIWRFKDKSKIKSRTTKDMLIRMKQSTLPSSSSERFLQMCSSNLTCYNTSVEKTLSLCYTCTRKQEGMTPEWEKGQEKLSALVFTPDTICTWDHLLGLMSHITSAVCSQEVSHLLRLSHAPLTYNTAVGHRRRCCFTADLLFWKIKAVTPAG